jgi:hypothetical protein
MKTFRRYYHVEAVAYDAQKQQHRAKYIMTGTWQNEEQARGNPKVAGQGGEMSKKSPAPCARLLLSK